MCPTPAFGMAERDGETADQPFALDGIAA
jgi:hypothetical protein